MNIFGRWIKRTFRGRKAGRTSPRRGRLHLEALEDRCLPSTPTVSSIAFSNPAGQFTNAGSVVYAVTFDEAVNGVAAADFQVVTTGNVGATSPVAVSGSGASYTVTVNGVHGNGTLQLDLIDNGSITSQDTSTPLANSFQGQTYSVLQADPYVVSINRATPATAITNATSVSFTITFSTAVTGVASSDFTLATTGSVASTLTQVTPVSASVYTVTVSGLTGSGALGLNLTGDNGIHDLAGNSLTTLNVPAAFQGQQSFAAGGLPSSVAVGDLTGDGDADLVVANAASNSVSVLLSNGNGTFQAQQTFAVGADPVAVGVEDVNGDGIPDLVVVNRNDSTVSVLLGNGNGTFQAQQTFAVGADPSSLAIGDVIGDGQADVIVANAASNTISVLLGNGNGTFQNQQIYTTGSGPSSVALGDLNGDGKADVIVANATSNTVSVLLGNGNGTFQTQQTFATGAGPASVALGDVNGDGNADLVVANKSGNSVSVLLGNGNGTFQPQQTFAAGSAPAAVAIGDVNGDGDDDLVVASSANNTASVLLGNGNGTFQAQQAFVAGAPGNSLSSVALGDVNGDGRTDLVFANVGGASVLLNNLNGNFTGQAFTIDHNTPTSSVNLPIVSNTTSFAVFWSGSDGANGAGIASYNVYVSDNNGPFKPFLMNTSQTGATYNGVNGHTYGFYSVATDNAGNQQTTPAGAQAAIEVLTAISYGSTATVGLSFLDPNPVGAVTYSTTLVDPLSTVETKYDFTSLDGYFNYRGQNEKYLLSNNNSNPAGHNRYVLMPNGNIYALILDANNDLNATLAAQPIASVSTAVYANPALLIDDTGTPLVTSGTNPLYNLMIQDGLVTPVNPANTSARGANEEYLQSTNGANLVNGGYFILMPNNELYMWTGGPLSADTLVANFNAAPYAAAVPTTSTTIDQSNGITATATSMIVASSTGFPATPFVVQIGSELVKVTGISGTTWTIVRGVDGTTAAADLDGATITFGNVYANPSLLTSATLTTATGVVATTNSNNGGTLTLTPAAGFDGSVKVTITATDSSESYSQSFTLQVNDTPPNLPAVNAITSPHGTTPAPFNLHATDAESAPLTYSVTVAGYNPLYDLQQQYGLRQADQTQYYNHRGQNEKYLLSANGSNPSGGNYYVLMPTDKLYAYVPDANNDLVATLANPPVADFTAAPYANLRNVYNAPALLYNALPPSSPTIASNRGPLYDIQTQFGLTVPVNAANNNKRGADEKYLQSTNQSNPSGGNYYVLMPTDKLYVYVPDPGNDLAATLANPPVADFTQPQYAAVGNIWATPSLLASAQPAYINDPVYNVRQTYGLTTADQTKFYDFRGQNEKYLKSTNGSNSANGGWYVLMPNDKLYTYVKDANNDLAATLANPPVFDFTTYGNVYADPALLYAATGRVAAVTAVVSPAGVVSITPNVAFTGTVRITATVSDGAETSVQRFLFTVSDAAPTVAPIAAVTVASSAGSKTITYTAGAANGATVLPAASISGYNPLYNVQQLYGLTTAPTTTTKNGKILVSGNGSNPANGGEYLLSTNDKLYAWTGQIKSTLAAAPVADFTSATYTSYNGANVYNDPALLYAAPQPAAPSITTSFPSVGALLLSWTPGFTGTFLTTLYIGDGSLETQQSFLVTVD